MGAGIRLAMEAGLLGGQMTRSEIQALRDLRREINEAYRAQDRSEALRAAVARCAGV